uniref:Uncharacterized protein n=1 Tax=Eutreptiella gymnastica TaxID=73025 RepID=A0A7S4FRR1_9EUGL|mmetsp:Transcript_55014/g.90701  ORF Transcript_55014/g.90701 Transcript_55014/m.90701 type:complete len:148 (+) Transcript_55014:82-525(+)
MIGRVVALAKTQHESHLHLQNGGQAHRDITADSQRENVSSCTAQHRKLEREGLARDKQPGVLEYHWKRGAEGVVHAAEINAVPTDLRQRDCNWLKAPMYIAVPAPNPVPKAGRARIAASPLPPCSVTGDSTKVRTLRAHRRRNGASR